MRIKKIKTENCNFQLNMRMRFAIASKEIKMVNVNAINFGRNQNVGASYR